MAVSGRSCMAAGVALALGWAVLTTGAVARAAGGDGTLVIPRGGATPGLAGDPAGADFLDSAIGAGTGLQTAAIGLGAFGAGAGGQPPAAALPLFSNVQLNTRQWTSDAPPVAALSSGAHFADIYEIDSTYTQRLSGFDIRAGTGFIGAPAAPSVGAIGYHDLHALSLGVSVGYGGLSVGGGFVDSFDSGYATRTPSAAAGRTTLDVGAQYAVGPLMFGAGVARSHDAGVSAFTGGGQPGDRTVTVYSAGVTYAVSPGLSTTLEYDHFNLTAPSAPTTGAASGDSGDVVLIRQMLNF